MINKFTYIKLAISIILFVTLLVFFGYSLNTYQELNEKNDQKFETELQKQVEQNNLQERDDVSNLIADYKQTQADLKFKETLVALFIMIGLLILIVMEGGYLITKSFKN